VPLGILLKHHHLLAQLKQLLEHAEAQLAQSAEHHVIGHRVRHGAHPLAMHDILAQEVEAVGPNPLQGVGTHPGRCDRSPPGLLVESRDSAQQGANLVPAGDEGVDAGLA
jgi:hypothetical protein